MKSSTVALLPLLLLFSRLATAQVSTPVDSYVIRFYAQGAVQPTQQQTVPASRVTCNLTPVTASLAAINPQSVSWDDPDNTGRECAVTFMPTDTLQSLPVGNYEGTVTAVNLVVGESQESNRAPFQRLNPPPPRKNVRFRR